MRRMFACESDSRLLPARVLHDDGSSICCVTSDVRQGVGGRNVVVKVFGKMGGLKKKGTNEVDEEEEDADA